MVVYGDLAVIASPAAESRRGELSDAERSIAEQGYRLARIEPPGTLDRSGQRSSKSGAAIVSASLIAVPRIGSRRIQLIARRFRQRHAGDLAFPGDKRGALQVEAD